MAIYGPSGQEFKSKQRWPTFASIGSTGLREWQGWLGEEWDPQLRGQQGRKVIREMADNHPIIGGVLLSIEMMCRQVGYTVKPGTDDPQGEEAAQLIEESLHDMEVTFEDKVGEIISGMLPYGFEPHEKNFKLRDGNNSKYKDGKVGWEDWPIRGQETVRNWQWSDDNRRLLGLWQQGPPDNQLHFIPMEKMLLFRTSARKGNPEGHMLLRNAYVPYRFQKQIQLIEAIGIERDMAGLPFARIPASIINSTNAEDVATYQAWQKVVTNMRRNEQDGLVLPSDRDDKGNLLYEVGLLNSGGQRQFDTDKIIARYDERIAISMLAGFILLGMENVGSHALGQTMSQLFTTSLGAFLASIVSVINDAAIPQLLALNGMPTDEPPTLEHGRIERMDFQAVAQALQLISAQNQRGAGIQLDTRLDGNLAKWFMEVLGAPEPPDPADLGLQVSAPASGQDNIQQLQSPPEELPVNTPRQPEPVKASEPTPEQEIAIGTEAFNAELSALIDGHRKKATAGQNGG